MEICSTRNTSKNCDYQGLESKMEVEIVKNEGIKMKVESRASIMEKVGDHFSGSIVDPPGIGRMSREQAPLF